MPIYKNKGLKGLRSFSELSEQEREDFKRRKYWEHPEAHNTLNSLTEENWSNMYDNNQFRETFDVNAKEDLYRNMPKQERDAMYRSRIINDAVAEQFANNKDALWQLNNNGVTDEGKIDLLESGYMNDEQWEQHSNTVKDNFRQAGEYLSSTAYAGQAGINAYNWEEKANDELAKERIQQQKILDEVIKKDNARNIESVHNSAEYGQALDYFSSMPTDALTKMKDDIVEGYWIDDTGKRVEAVPKYSNEIQNEITALEAERQALLSKYAPDETSFMSEASGYISPKQEEQIRELAKIDKRLKNLYKSQKTEYDYYYINDDGTRGERVPTSRQKTDAELVAEGYTAEQIQNRDKLNPRELETKNDVHNYPGSPYYRAFKDNGDFDNYDHNDWAKLVAEYATMVDMFGENAAKSAINGKMEKQVADNQSWMANFHNTLWTKFGVNSIQTVSPIVNALRAKQAAGQEVFDADGNIHTLTYEEALGNIHAGLNPDGTESKVWDIWNPKNISRMERTNSLNPLDIWEAEENGGISDKMHVYQPEDANKMITWEMAVHEGLAMGAYTASSMLVNYAVGGVFGALGQAGKWLSPAIAGMATSIPISEGYSQSNFEQVMDNGLQKIEQLKYQDGQQYVNSLKETNKDAYEHLVNQWIDNNSAKPKYNEEGKLEGYEGIMAPASELRRMAEQNVDETLIANYVTNKGLWTKDYDGLTDELKKDAALAYQFNFAEEFLANTAVNYLFRSYMMTPGQRAQLKAKNPFFKTFFGETGKAERDLTIFGKQLTEKQFNTVMGLGKGARNVWGGYWSNKMDDVRLAVAQQVGMNKWNNTVDAYYNSDNLYLGLSALNDTFDFSDIYSAMKQGFAKSYFAKETIRDGIIGGAGAFMGYMPNIGGIAKAAQKVQVVDSYGNPVKDSKGNPIYKNAFLYNEYGEKLSPLEIAANAISNGVLQEVADARAKGRATNRRLKKVNQLIDLYKDDLMDIGELMKLADSDYRIVMTGKPTTLSEFSDRETPSDQELSVIGEMHDNKLRKALKLISLTESWKNDPILKDSPMVQQTLSQIDEFRQNSISEKDIDAFVADKSNQKYFSKRMTAEQKREFAKQRLMKNQQTFVNLAENYAKSKAELLEKNFHISEEEFYDMMDSDREQYKKYLMALDYMIYNQELRKNYTERDKKLAQELQLVEEEYNPLWYGSKERYEKERNIAKEKIAILKGQEAIAKERIKKLKDIKNPTEEEEEEIKSLANEESLSSLRNRRAIIENDERQRSLDEAGINRLGNEVLSADNILKLTAKEQLEMLTSDREKEPNKYSEAQWNEIEVAKNKANEIDSDYLIKLNDLVAIRERLKENRFTQDQAYGNPRALLKYIDLTRRMNRTAEYAAMARMLTDGYWQAWENLEGNELKDAIAKSNLKSNIVEAYGFIRPNQAPLIKEVAGFKGVQEAVTAASRSAGEDLNQIYAIESTLQDVISNQRSTDGALAALDGYENYIKRNVENIANARELLSAISLVKKVEALKKQNQKVVIKGDEITKIKAESNAKVLTAKLELENQRKKNKERQEKLRRNRAARNKAKQLSKEAYDEYHVARAGRSSEEAAKQVRKSAAKEAKRILSKILKNKSFGAWKNNMLRNKFISADVFIETINLLQQYHNSEAFYTEFWDSPENNTIEIVKQIEQILADKGWSWKSIEGEVITRQMEKDMIVVKTTHDSDIYETVSIAEKSTPYIYKDGKLLAAPTANVVVGTKVATDELLNTQSKKTKKSEVAETNAPSENQEASPEAVEKSEEEEITFSEEEIEEAFTEVPDKPYTRNFGEGKEITLGDKIQILFYDESNEPYWATVQVIHMYDDANDNLVTVKDLNTGKVSGVEFNTLPLDNFKMLEHASQEEIDKLAKDEPIREKIEEKTEEKPKEETPVTKEVVTEEPDITFAEESEETPTTENPVEAPVETPVKEDTGTSDIEEVQEILMTNPDEDVTFIPIEEMPVMKTDDSKVSGEHLNGVNFLEYDVDMLRNQRMWQPTKQKSTLMNKVHSWLKGNKIKLQEIVDKELVRILQDAPDTKIYFMRPASKEIGGILFNVIEYTDKVKELHDNELGGVVKAQTKNGEKEFLVVGTLGYFGSVQQNAYQNIAKQIHSQASFYSPQANFVDMTMHTQVSKIQSDTAVKLAEGEESVEYRPLQALLEDSNRNPYGFTRKTLTYGFMKQKGMDLRNKLGRDVNTTRSEMNQGSVYIFIPNANGEFIPVYIQPTTLKEIASDKDTTLGDHIYDIVEKLTTSRDIQSAMQALDELNQYIVLGKEQSHNIEVTESGVIQFYVGNQEVASMQLGDMNAATEFLNRITNSAARVNITPKVFTNDAIWNMYNESGALSTDYSRLYTVGTTYTVYPVDSNGLPMTGATIGTNQSNKSKLGRQLETIQYKGEAYYIMRDNPNVWVDKNLNPVKDLDVLKACEAKVAITKMLPAYKNVKDSKEYYILNSQTKEAVSFNPETKEIKYLTEEQYDALERAISNLPRERKATETIKKIEDGTPKEVIVKPENPIEFAEEEKTEQPDINPEDKIRIESEKNGNFALQEAFITADETLQDEFVEAVIEKVTSDLGKAEGDRVSEMSAIEQIEYLKSKGVQTENINDLQHWIDYLKNCIKLK